MSPVDKRTAYGARVAGGSLWLLISGGMAFFLQYARIWCANQIDPTTEVLGYLALVLMFQNVAGRFLMPGNKNTVTALASRLVDPRQRSGFTTTYYLICAATLAVAIPLALLFPEPMAAFFDLREADRWALPLLLAVLPLHLLFLLLTSVLTAQMEFRVVAAAMRVQGFFIALAAGGFYLLGGETLRQRPLEIWVGVALVSEVLIAALCLWALYRKLPFVARPYWPAGGLRFAVFAGLGNLLMLGREYSDQFIVNLWYGPARLGVYFTLLQIAMIMPMAMMQLGHLLLSSFANLRARGERHMMLSLFRRICRFTVLLHAVGCLALVLASHPVAGLMGAKAAENHRWLILLAASMSVQSTLSPCSMLIQAHERMGTILWIQGLQVVIQLGLTLALIGPFAVDGIIWARLASFLVLQLALFLGVWLTLRATGEAGGLPWRSWLTCQGVVALAGVIAWRWSTVKSGMPLAWAAAFFGAGLVVTVVLGGYNLEEFRVVVKVLRKRGGGSTDGGLDQDQEGSPVEARHDGASGTPAGGGAASPSAPSPATAQADPPASPSVKTGDDPSASASDEVEEAEDPPSASG